MIPIRNYKPIIMPHEVNELSRQCSADELLIATTIEEVELLDIKPKLGDKLFLKLTSNDEFSLLLNGGDYIDAGGETRMFAGLKRAAAYYTWARLVKTSVNNLTRFGYVVKNDDYSHQSEYKERQVAYNDAFSVADDYMKDCLEYMQANPDIFAEYTLKGKVISNRTRYKIIGD